MREREREGAAADSLRATYPPPYLRLSKACRMGTFLCSEHALLEQMPSTVTGMGMGNRQMNEAWGASSQLSQGAGHGRAIRHVLSQRCQWVW